MLFALHFLTNKNLIFYKTIIGKMMSSRFSNFIFAIFFLLHASRTSLANAHQANAADGFEASVVKEYHSSAQKELVDANNNVMKATKRANGGRKMIMDHQVMKKPSAATLSGSGERNAQRNPPSITVLSKSKKSVTQDDESKARKHESKRLFEGAKEIMKLMSKDYGGRFKPKRKPPIHNL